MNAQEKKELTQLTVKVGVIEERQLQHAKVQTEIQESQDSTHKKVDNLLFHLIGDPKTKTKGWIEKQEIQETRLSRLEKVYLVVGLIFGLIFMLKDHIIELFTNK